MPASDSHERVIRSCDGLQEQGRNEEQDPQGPPHDHANNPHVKARLPGHQVPVCLKNWQFIKIELSCHAPVGMLLAGPNGIDCAAIHDHHYAIADILMSQSRSRWHH